MRTDNQMHMASKVLALADELEAQGFRADRAVQDAGLTLAALRDPATRISQDQILAVCRAADAMAPGSELAFRAGRRVHITHLGMFGFAALSQRDMRAVLDFALRYRPLSAPMVGLSVREGPETFDLIFEPLLGLPKSSPEFRFVLEFNIAMFATLAEDCLGTRFRVHSIRVSAADMPAAKMMQRTFQAPLFQGAEINCLALPLELISVPLVLGNALTAEIARRTCDDLLLEMAPGSALLKRITTLLMERRNEMMSLPEVAAALAMSERTLRRRLSDEGTTYNTLRNGLRRELALKYLRGTSMTNEDIAQALGFSDATNFATAFRKWTGRTPGSVRRPIWSDAPDWPISKPSDLS